MSRKEFSDFMARPARLERATCGFEVRRSIQLSYGRRKNQWDTDKHSAALPQPKILCWTQMDTDKHRSYFRKRCKDKRLNGTRMNTDAHG